MSLHGNVHPEKLGDNYDGDYDCPECGQRCGGTFQCGCCGRIVGWCQGGDTLGPQDDVCSYCLAKMSLPDDTDYQSVRFGWRQKIESSGFRWVLVSAPDNWWSIYRGPTCDGSLGFSRNLYRSRLSGGKSLEPTDDICACARALLRAVQPSPSPRSRCGK